MPTNSEALAELQEHLVQSGLGPLLENIHTLTVLVDPRGTLVGWNPACGALLKVLPNAGSLQELVSSEVAAGVQLSIENVLRNGNTARLRLELGPVSIASAYDCVLIRLSDQDVLLIGEPALRATARLREAAAPVETLPGLQAQLQEAKQALENKQKELQAVLAQTDEVVHTDALTLLPNRKWIIADLQRQVTYSERYGAPLSISMVDLDYFKEVNDNFGHAAGDQVLRFIASEIRDRIRQPDEIGRYGGDEFLVILPNTPISAAAEQAARLCSQVRSMPIRAGKDEIRVGLSIGIAQYKVSGDDWRSLLERADQALYQAKRNGRGQWAMLES